MSKVQYVLFHLTLLSFVNRCLGLVELPPVEDNSIVATEAVIRNTINQIFSSLQLKKARERPKIKQYGLIHNYFTSVTLRDYNNLKEIARLTRVDNKNVDNTTLSFIALINAILNGDSFENEENYTNSLEYITEDAANYLQSFLKQLNDFGEIVSNGPRIDVNEEVNKILARIPVEDLNLTESGQTTHHNSSEEDNNILDDSEFWHPTEETRRIYKGKRARIKTFPFMAVIQIFNVFQCAGSIIHKDLILTAASCLQLAYNNRFYRENPAFLSVRVGSNYHDGGGEVIPVLEVFFYPAYNPKTLRNNIAVVRLVRQLKLTRKKVKKIAIDTVDAPLASNTPAITIIGWGAKTASNVIRNGFENQLSYAILPFYGLHDCQEIYSKEYVTQKNFCAGYITKGSGACNRDVGGPGVVAGVLRGVVSFGSPQCGTADAPTVFTKVGYYADWIETIMDQDVPTGKKHTPHPTDPWTYISWQTPTPRPVLTPVSGTILPTTETLFLGVATTTTPMVGRQSKKVDMKLFREFLSTMFNSQEVDEYLDQFMSAKGIGRELTTESLPAVEFATKFANFEPEPSDYEADWTETTTEATKHATKGLTTEKNIEAEKELERDIMELINSADLRQILIDSVVNATKPIQKTETTKKMKKKAKKAKKWKGKGKKEKGEKKTQKRKQDKKDKKGKNNKKYKTGENVMEFLYLSDGEKNKKDDIKIFNKADDDVDNIFEDSLNMDVQDGQDVVLHMTQETEQEDDANNSQYTRKGKHMSESEEDTAKNDGNNDVNNNINNDVKNDDVDDDNNDVNNESAEILVEGPPSTKISAFLQLKFSPENDSEFQSDNDETNEEQDDVESLTLGNTKVLNQQTALPDNVNTGEEDEGLNLYFDVPTFINTRANQSETFRANDKQPKNSSRIYDKAKNDNSSQISKTVMVDILNEVMISESQGQLGNATNNITIRLL